MLTRRRALQLGLAALVVAPARATKAGKIIRLRPQPATAPLMDSPRATEIWGYGAKVPGPVLRATAGEILTVELDNALPMPTTVHWHGIHIDNAMDGAAGLTQSPVAPGEKFLYRFSVPDAGTYWYHPHFRSWESQTRGLYGFLIVDELDPLPVDREYLLALDDWRLDENDQIDLSRLGNLHDASHAGRLGNVLTTNGLPAPEMPVRRNERIRLRLLNAANSRVLTLGFGQFDATLIALDGRAVAPRSLPQRRLTLAPAQRADVIVDIAMRPGETNELVAITRGGTTPAAAFHCVKDSPREHPRAAEVALPPHDLARELSEAALQVELVMRGGAMGRMSSAVFEGREQTMRELVRKGQVWSLNNLVGRTDTPLFRVAKGRTVHVRLVNETRWPHGMHFHGHHVQLMRSTRHETEGDWRDTVLLDTNETATVRFVASNPGRWVLHCHMLEHMASGMSTWFEVT